MYVTTITLVDNRSSGTIQLMAVDGGAPNTVTVGPVQAVQVSMNVPWALDGTATGFGAHHIELRFGSVTKFWIWQYGNNQDGNHVRFSIDGNWNAYARPVHGLSAVDTFDGTRTLVVRDTCFELTELPASLAQAIDTMLGPGGYHLSGQYGDRPALSTPKAMATAFSMAGPPSDALAQSQAGAQWLYRDEGKRYRFVLANGVVTAIEPDGNQIPLTSAVSYQTLRTGERYTAPPFDLIAAGGGRLFAKQQGVDCFYFASMDQTLVGAADDGTPIAIPSTYFKVDPQFNQPGAVTGNLTAPFEGCFGGHPGAERFPLFQFALAQNLIDMMMIRLRPRVWHLADTRPPLGTFNVEVLGLKAVLEVSPLNPLLAAPGIQELIALTQQAILGPDISPPAGIPTYPAADYTMGSNALTCWVDPHVQHVAFGSANGHVYELTYPLAGGSWHVNDLTALAAAPPAAGALTSWVDSAFQHVVYASGDGHVHELYYPLAGGSWHVNDLTALTGAPWVRGALTSWVDSTHQHVVLASGDGHVHELYYPLAGGAWGVNDLTALAGAPLAAVPGPLTSWVDHLYQHVVFGSADAHLHELFFPLAGGTWAVNDLTALTGAPLAAAGGGALTSWVDPSYQHVAFVSGDGHVRELRYPLAGGAWTAADLTTATGAPLAAVPGSLTSWVNASDQHVVYDSADGHVHELFSAPGTEQWAAAELTAATSAPPATTANPLGSWVDAKYQHVAFASADGHVHELYYPLAGGGWAINDLTALAGAPGMSVPLTLPAIDFDQVLDIGVGHSHWHEQYDGRTGGEIQPMFTGPLLGSPAPPVTLSDLYRWANGPVRDGDGFIDGTCNYYALVHLRNAGYALVYIDEQSYFVQRWRLVDPRDSHGMMTALTAGLASNPALYHWNPSAYWDPFQAREITSTSRLAVSRQVLLVSAPDPQKPSQPAAVVFSINFSYATMDRSWRWRSLPGQARYFSTDAQKQAEPIDPTVADTVYPETIRLREDMTIHVKGTQRQPAGTIVVGRWHQRYLPAGNVLVPPASELNGSRPAANYTHPWKFLPEAVFLAADQFSHLGVYAPVDSRCQYYTVTPATAADANSLSWGMIGGPWIDTNRTLCTRLLEFQWAAPLRLPDIDPAQTLWNLQIVGPPRSPASLLNAETRLRIVPNGSGWLATHWDKRDDDLIPFWGLPVTVTLNNSGRTATVTLESCSWGVTIPPSPPPPPPAAPAAEFAWTGNPKQPVQITLTSPQNVSRVRLAALDPVPDPSSLGAAATVVSMLDVPTAGYFGSNSVFAWSPSARVQATLARYCTPAGALAHGTSLWCEDLLGHASLPDSMVWAGTAPNPAVTGQLWHTIRNPDGSWAATDNVNSHISVAGPVSSAGAASTAAGTLELAFTTTDGRLWHSVRNPDGSWTATDNMASHIVIPFAVTAVAASSRVAGELDLLYTTADGELWLATRSAGAWGSVEELGGVTGNIGTITAITVASCQPSQTQIMLATREGGLWHTIMYATGGWQPVIGNVKAKIGDPGVVVAVAAASPAPGVAQFMFATVDGRLWHTIRNADGTWTGLGNVKGQIGDPGPVTGVSATSSAPGVVQFMFTTADGGLWHTIRNADGTWTGLGNVKGQIGDQGAMSTVAAASTTANQAQYLIA